MAAGDVSPQETPQGWARIECESVLMVLKVLRFPKSRQTPEKEHKGDTKLTVKNLLYVT